MPANALPCLMILIGFGLVIKGADLMVFVFMHTGRRHVRDLWQGILFVALCICYTVMFIVQA